MKWVKNVTVIAFALALLMLLQTFSVSSVNADISSSSYIDQFVYPDNQVIDVSITINEDDYQDLLANAMDETTYMADITYNGVALESVGIRAKGNSSLKSVAQSGGDRFSFKIDIDEYIDGQSLYGISKFNLNNLYEDPSMMAEFLTYEMLESIDADAARTCYVNLVINGESRGLYLAVEQVNEEFLIEHYGNANGDLYKPDMGVGSDLAYVDTEEYSGLINELDSADNTAIRALIEAIEKGEDIDSIFNVDSFLKYMAVSSMVIHLDSYQGGMYHNYYLYNNNDVWEWIGWDFNMAFNGFPMTALSDEEAIKLLIDEPTVGAMENYPLVEAIFSDSDNIETYHAYLEALMVNYLSQENFEQRVLEVYQLIDAYVKADPTSFYSYEDFQSALFGDDSILTFISERSINVEQQLSGVLDSSNNGQGNAVSKGGMDKQNAGRPAMNNQAGNNTTMVNQNRPTNKDKVAQTPMDTESILTVIEKVTDGKAIPQAILTSLEAGTPPDQDTMRTWLDSLDESQRTEIMSVLMPQDQRMPMANERGMNQEKMPGEEVNNVAVESNTRNSDGLLLTMSAVIVVLGASFMISRLKR